MDGQRLCITGRSAGGYTTLACLAFRDTFKAGAALYGVSHPLVSLILTFYYLNLDSVIYLPSISFIFNEADA